METPVITTSGLTKVYRSRGREVTALDGVDLHVREGEVYGVIGQSGAGKSSLIRCVNLLERPTAGTVTVAGQDLTALAGRGSRAGRELRQARSRIGMVFQHFNLLSTRTVLDVTFQGEAATQPVISQLSRTYNIDISILGAAIDTVGGLQVGRMRIELPGRYEDNVVPVGFLREQGLQIDVVGEPQLVKEGAK